MRSGTLPDAVKVFIVQQLAMWDPPSVVVADVNATFGLKLSRQAVERYNPEKRAGRALSPKLRELFHATRAEFTANTAAIGITHKSTRLRGLQRLYDRAISMGASAEARACLEQVAKEEGGAYTNTRIVRGGLELTTPKSLADFYAENGLRPAAADASENTPDTLPEEES